MCSDGGEVYVGLQTLDMDTKQAHAEVANEGW